MGLPTNSLAPQGGDRSAPSPPPGPRTPGTLQSVRWFRRPVRFMERGQARFGDAFSVRLGGMRRATFLADPDAVRTVLTGDPDLFMMGATNAIFRPVLGSSSMFLLDGDEHRRHRRVLAPAFRHRRVADAGPLLEGLIEREVRHWVPDETYSVYDRMRIVILDLILRVLFGPPEGGPHSWLRVLLPRLLDQVTSPLTLLPGLQYELGGLSPFGRMARTLRRIDEVLYAEIRAWRTGSADREAEGVIPALAATPPGGDGYLSDVEIRDEALTLLVAGHETTATAIAWAVERLVRHPAAAERLVAELDAGENAYLRAAIKESLRQRPVLPITARKAATGVRVGRHEYPAQWTLIPCIYLVHHDPTLFPEPERFRPERFLGPNPAEGVWVPFGAGARRCLGSSLAMEALRVAVGCLLRSLVLAPDDETPEPIVRRSFILAPGRGARVRVLRHRGRSPRAIGGGGQAGPGEARDSACA